LSRDELLALLRDPAFEKKVEATTKQLEAINRPLSFWLA